MTHVNVTITRGYSAPYTPVRDVKKLNWPRSKKMEFSLTHLLPLCCRTDHFPIPINQVRVQNLCSW